MDVFQLTAAISGFLSAIKEGLDIPVLSDNLDAIHIMAYDFHGSWESRKVSLDFACKE